MKALLVPAIRCESLWADAGRHPKGCRRARRSHGGNAVDRIRLHRSGAFRDFDGFGKIQPVEILVVTILIFQCHNFAVWACLDKVDTNLGGFDVV
ncbi:MAG: hypothetical protein WCL04_09510, partial [Verrucomicrobiota bacterium]